MSHNDQTPLNHYNYASQLAVVQSADLNNVTQFPKPKSTNKVSSFSPTFTAPKRNVQFDFTKRGGKQGHDNPQKCHTCNATTTKKDAVKHDKPKNRKQITWFHRKPVRGRKKKKERKQKENKNRTTWLTARAHTARTAIECPKCRQHHPAIFTQTENRRQQSTYCYRLQRRREKVYDTTKRRMKNGTYTVRHHYWEIRQFTREAVSAKFNQRQQHKHLNSVEHTPPTCQ